MNLYIVTGLHLGWDCVVAVFPQYQYTKEQLKEVFSEDDGFVIHEQILAFDLDDFR